jgi:hypothetical protein
MATKRSQVNVSEAVAWAAYNYERCVIDNNGRMDIKFEKAETPPPSDIARSYLRFAAGNPAHFFSKTVPQFLGEEDVISEEDAAHDKKLVTSLRAVLRKFTETAPTPVKEKRERKKDSLVQEDEAAGQGQDETDAAG